MGHRDRQRWRACISATLLTVAVLSSLAACAEGGEGTQSPTASTRRDSGGDVSSTGGTAGSYDGGVSGGSAGSGSGSGGMSGTVGSSGAATDSSGDVIVTDANGGDASNPDGGVLCSDVPEVCNGLDDNCSGTIDEGDPGGGGPCTVAGQKGMCAEGVLHCTASFLSCTQVNFPSATEICDGLDNDCNGTVDDGNPGAGQPCDTKLPGVCAAGTTACINGGIQCQQTQQPSTEICDGLDNDCNGIPDDGFSGAGQPCTVPGAIVGTPCAQGLTNCLGGANGCTPLNVASKEICDGTDNDCNGMIDDGIDGKSCPTGLPGACATGKYQCVAPSLNCVPDVAVGTVAETCNGIDDDCNGIVDDVQNINVECASKNSLAQNVGGWLCTSGFCQIAVCSGGFADCNGAPGDGCEANTSISALNCGSCGNACNSTHGTPSCQNGVCGIACDTGFLDCDGSAANGCEVDASTNVDHCGSCSTQCTNSGGSAACVGGTCAPTCSSGWGDCDGNPTNGCETDLTLAVNDCGACGRQCTNSGGTTSCLGAICMPVCSSGRGDCDGNLDNGCETNLTNSTNDCGACGTHCLNPNGTTSCVNSVCAPSCSAGAADCDGNKTNGCETSTNTDVNNCGSCGYKCTNPAGSVSCVSGACVVGCNPGFADCNNSATDGCEVNVTNDINNCGGCGTQCTNAHGSTSCSNGSCVPVCNAGFGNCDGNPVNGCETDTSSTVTSCGSCGNACSFPNAAASCSGGSCVLGACTSGYGNCDGSASNGCERALNTVTSCGSCTNACTNPNGTTSCTSGACVPICASGWQSCDGNPSNGCETSLKTLSDCGSCGTVCNLANAAESCATGTCVLGACDAGWGNCDTNPSTGCETSIQTSVSNCGSCGTVCSSSNGTASCNQGACAIACNSGYGNCDGNAQSNGCETNVNTDPSHCGNCSTSCAGGQCINGGCCTNCCTPGVDTDGDGMDDCTELNDGDPWTDKDIFNGMRVREANQCSLLGLCSDNDTLAKVNACMNTTIEQQKDQYSGWDWNDPPDSICSSGYNFQPNWTYCDSSWQADWQGYINFTSAGQQCFQVGGGLLNAGACASLFFNTETTAIQTGGAAKCFNVAAGVYPIRWHYTMAVGSISSMHVRYCFGGGATCSPSAALPARMLRVTYP